MSNSKAKTRIILSPASKVPEFLSKLDKKNIKIIPREKNNGRCYIIKDNNEVMLFLRNASYPSDNIFAIWSNSKSIIDSLGQLFEYSWNNAKLPLTEVVS
jgi:hypothetical protein